MKLIISYPEIEHAIFGKYGSVVSLEPAGPEQVRVRYGLIKLNMRIESVCDSSIVLSYGSGCLVEKTLPLLLSLFKGKMGDLLETMPEHRLCVRLDQNQDIAKLLEQISIKEAVLSEDGLVVVAYQHGFENVISK